LTIEEPVIDPTARLTVARGHNLVVGAPPSPAALQPVLLGIIDRAAERPDGTSLALAPSEAVSEWTRIGALLAEPLKLPVSGTGSPERLSRILETTRQLVFTSPTAALDLVGKAGLDPAGVPGLLVLYPELWGPDGDGQLTALFQDLPKETQRIIVTSDPDRIGTLAERYAWRAPIHDSITPVPEGAWPPVRVTPVPWRGRVEAIREIIEQLNPESVAVWTASELDQAPIRQALLAAGAGRAVTSQVPSPASLIIAYDLPAPATLRELAASGDVLLLMPSGTEPYVGRLAPNRKPLHLRGALDRARTAADRIRNRIIEAMDQDAGPGLFTLAPLLERYDAPAVAAALLGLWQEAESRAGSQAPVRRVEVPARLWISAGKRDGATPSDLVAILVRECETPREAIGKIEIRESFSLVEIAPSAGPEQVAERLTGKSVRKRRVVARLDRPSPAVERVAKRLPRPKDRRRT
jgi:hypothetical protein